MAKKNVEQAKTPISQEMLDACLAHAVAEGDIVNFRFMFMPNSPLRDDCPEEINSAKYAYLRPADTTSPRIKEALDVVRTPEMQAWVREQLKKQGPSQLPWELLLPLADNAVRLGKYTTAAQAYELLRVRGKMQELTLCQADDAMAKGDISRAVNGYLIGVGLEYDYAAFPEPLPSVPDYQKRALMIHAEYPGTPEDYVAWKDDETQATLMLDYLLGTAVAARLTGRPLAQRQELIIQIIRRIDPHWDAFVAHYRESCAVMQEIGTRLEQQSQGAAVSLSEEAALAEEISPERIPTALLGRRLQPGEWWDYLKELTYEHPAAVLFVSRQMTPRETEIIVPRYRSEAVLAQRLGLVQQPSAQTEA